MLRRSRMKVDGPKKAWKLKYNVLCMSPSSSHPALSWMYVCNPSPLPPHQVLTATSMSPSCILFLSPRTHSHQYQHHLRKPCGSVNSGQPPTVTQTSPQNQLQSIPLKQVCQGRNCEWKTSLVEKKKSQMKAS